MMGCTDSMLCEIILMADPNAFVENDIRDSVITQLLTIPENKVSNWLFRVIGVL